MRPARLTTLIALAAVATLPSGAAANVRVGASGWQWGNPAPQGNTLRALAFAGPRGYAAGDFGTLLATDDSGATWRGLPVASFTALTEVQAVDADTVIAGGGCVARRSDDGGLTFARIAFTPVESSCREPLVAFTFPAERTGYVALADGTVLRTQDGGAEFEQKRAVPGTRAPGGAAVPTDLAASGADLFAASTEGKIFTSTDTANSWREVHDADRAVRSIEFTSAGIGYAVGDGALFLRTVDGGQTWQARDVGAATDLSQIRCASQTLCVAASQRGDVIVRTADGGASFTLVTPSTDRTLAIAWASPTRLVAVGADGATVTSDDGGQNFTPVGSRLAGRYFALRAGLSAGTAFAPGADGALARTVDGGATWVAGSVPTSEDVRDVAFPTANDGYALDIGGGLFRTATGGQTWRPLDTGTSARPGAVHATDVNTVLLIGPTGVRRSTDGGTTFAAVSGEAVARAPLAALDVARGAVFAYGAQKLIVSTDAGETWAGVRKPGHRVGRVNRRAIRAADFVTPRSGYLVDTTGRVWKTRDGGRAWRELTSVGTSVIVGIAFSTERKGYVVIGGSPDAPPGSGLLLRTDDGGATWRPQLVASGAIAAAGIAAPDGKIDYLLSGQSSLLSTTTGGDEGADSTVTIASRRRALRRPARIRVTGTLDPATGGELIVVSYRRPGAVGWRFQVVKVSASGSFTSSWDVPRGKSLFVAQWRGDFRSRGDGSPALIVRVR